MTQEVLDSLQGETKPEAAEETAPEREVEERPLRPGDAVPPPLTGEEEGSERPNQAERDPSSAPSGHLPLKGKAEERNRRESGENAFVPDARKLREHLALLRAQAAEMPGFDLEQALRDPAFVRLTAPGVGVSVRDAWYALHREETERRRSEENRAMLARAAAASARRPREGGGSGGTALIAADYRSLSRAEQLRVKQRILEAGARGEKVYP